MCLGTVIEESDSIESHIHESLPENITLVQADWIFFLESKFGSLSKKSIQSLAWTYWTHWNHISH